MHIAFIQGIGPLELTIILVIVLVIFGPKRLPALARSVGSSFRELKRSATEKADAADHDRDEPATIAPPSLGPADEPAAAPRPVEGEVTSDRR